VFGESFAGVLAGGRTGLTAFGMALLFLLTLPLHPLLEAVPLCASAPVLVVLGSQLLALIPGACARKHLDFDDMSHGFPSFVTIVGMPFFAGIEKGIAAGLASWAALQVVDLGWRAALHCLAALLRGAAAYPCSRAMASALYELAWTLRLHDEGAVRRAALVSLCTVGRALLPAVLVAEYQEGLPDLQDWLRVTAENDADDACRQLAAACHAIYGGAVREEMKLADHNLELA